MGNCQTSSSFSGQTSGLPRGQLDGSREFSWVLGAARRHERLLRHSLVVAFRWSHVRVVVLPAKLITGNHRARGRDIVRTGPTFASRLFKEA